jgi:hypothetical protein
MGPNETDIYKSYRELNYDYQAEVIAHDVEHIPLVAYCIYRVEVLFDIRKASPSTTLYNACPDL